MNGILKLQVGQFEKETSPNILKGEGLAVYQNYVTITSFPLMYAQYALPMRYLNLSMQATDSYWEAKGNITSADFTEDWKKINTEIVEYNHLVSSLISDDVFSDRKGVEILKRFGKKRDEWIKREEFVDPYKRECEQDYYTPPQMERTDTTYMNKYLYVSISDYNDFHEKRETYAFNEYYEECP